MHTQTLTDHIAESRTMKAERIAQTLIDHGVDASQAAHLSIPERRGYEALAGVRLGSALTWREAVDMLARSARTPCPFCGHGDPDGVVGPPQPFGHEGPCSR